MSEEKQINTPAFPAATLENGVSFYEPGMSKRFYAACAAMQGLLSNHVYMDNLADMFENGDMELVKDAYEIADKLLKKENE